MASRLVTEFHKTLLRYSMSSLRPVRGANWFSMTERRNAFNSIGAGIRSDRAAEQRNKPLLK